MQEITRRCLHGHSSTLSEIVTKTKVNKSTASRVVGRLVDRGYVFEEIDQEDRRVRQIHVTPSFEDEVMRHFEKLRQALPE